VSDYQANKIEAKRLEREATRQQQSVSVERQNVFADAIVEYKQDNPTFTDIPFANAIREGAHAQSLADFIMSKPDVGLPLVDALSKNLGEAQRIANLPPREQMWELTRISYNLSQPVQTKITKAPEPIKAVSGGVSTSAKLDLEKMSFKDYAKYRAQGGKV
jgi:hypothetical protein